jgi:hypothetical protein
VALAWAVALAFVRLTTKPQIVANPLVCALLKLR